MAYFRSFFGGAAAEHEENGAEIVEKLVERAETCTVLEDRRDSLRALRSMAKKLRLAVGTMGMNVFMEILEERSNQEMTTLSLEILVAVLSSDDENTDDDELGERLAEVMLKKPTFIPSLLSCLEQFDFSVRRAGIQLLTSLLRHRGPEVQAAVMGQTMGVSHLVDIVHDNREVVRNEAVLMLCELSRANSQIQQLLAYDNAFVLLLDIIESEPLDSIVIEDCLFVILNLLRRNAMNQQLFRENNLIPRLGIVLHTFLYGTEEDQTVSGEWAKQRTANLIFLLQIIRSLVSPDNAGSNTHAAQKVLHHTKMLAELCHVLLSELGVTVEVLTETIIVVAEAIRGNYTNQEYFSSTSLSTQENANRPSLLVLLISMTAEKQPFKLRCAVFYCFLSYLHDNEFGKTKIIETLLPSAQPDISLSSGALVCQAISSGESVQCWFGCVSLLHCLLDIEHLREQLLRVQLSTSADQPPVSLLRHISSLLISMGNRRVQMRAGLLMLLSVWLTNCTSAVKAFLENQENLHYLTTQIVDDCGEGSESEQQVLKGLMAFLLLACLYGTQDQTTRRSLEQLVDRRVGRDHLISALDGVSRTEQFVRAAQKPQPLAKSPNELFLDFHFIKLFKSTEGSFLKLLRPNGEYNGTTNNDSIIQSFKELIKRQDEEISLLKQDAKKATVELEQLRKSTEKKDVEHELEQVRAQLEQSCKLNTQNQTTQLQLQELHRINEQWRMETEKYKQWAQQWQQYQIAQLPNCYEVVTTQLKQQMTELEQQLEYGYHAFEEQSRNIAQMAIECAEWRNRAEAAEAIIKGNSDNAQKNGSGKLNGTSEHDEAELLRLRTEQEDLLVLLADQHNKINQYRSRLRQVGQTVTDDEDED